MQHQELTAGNRWVLAGHLLLALGSFALSIGTVLRLAEANGLPGQPMTSAPPTVGNPKPYWER